MEELQALNWLGLAFVIAVALAGMFAHYVKKWMRGETHDTLFQYLFGGTSWRNTVSAVAAVVVTVAGMFVTNQLDVSTIAGLMAIFTIGYAGDSALNKDSLLTKGQS